MDLWEGVPRMGKEQSPSTRTQACVGASVAGPEAVLSSVLARDDTSPTTLCLYALHSSTTFPGETLACPDCSQGSVTARGAIVRRGQQA